jgi:hypothetical protein
MNDLDKQMSFKTSLVIPIGHTRASVFDMFDLIDNNSEDLAFYADSAGNFVYLYLNTMLDLAVDGKVANFSNTEQNEYRLLSGTYFPPAGTVDDLSDISGIRSNLPDIGGDFDFNYNEYDNDDLVQRVDKVRVNSAVLNIQAKTDNITFTGGAKIQLQIKFPKIPAISSTTYNIDLDENDNSAQFPINNYFTIDFPSSRTFGTKTDISVKVVLLTAGGGSITFQNTSDIIVSTKMTNVSIAWAEGFFNRNNTITSDHIFADIPTDLWGYSQISNNRLLFHNPEITFKFNSNVGVPLSFVVDSIKAVDKNGQSVEASFGGNRSTQFSLAAPRNKGDFAFSSITFDRQNGGTNQLFTINPKEFIYGFHVEVDHPSAVANPKHFLVGPAAISMEAQAKLRFWFDETTQYVSRDTLNANLDSILNIGDYNIELERVAINIDFKNTLPLQVTATAKLIDENGTMVFVKENIAIASPTVDAQGLSTEEKTSQVSIPLIGNNMDEIMKAKKIVLEYRILGENVEKQINIRGTDSFDAFVSLFVKAKVETNLDTLFNKK